VEWASGGREQRIHCEFDRECPALLGITSGPLSGFVRIGRLFGAVLACSPLTVGPQAVRLRFFTSGKGVGIVRHAPRANTLGIAVVSVHLLAPVASPVTAQQVTGVLGSPGATKIITGQQLPPPEPKFGSARELPSPRPGRHPVVPPKDAPNVLLDDAAAVLPWRLCAHALSTFC
jgi:hypothetical protein